MMASTYNDWLVALSLAVATLVSFTALRLASRVAQSHQAANRPWLLLGGISMGVGIWSMHFIGMLALTLPIELRYDIPLTLLSLGAAIATSAFAIKIAAGENLQFGRHVLSSLIMGLGIVAMHYTGMAAIRIYPVISYDMTWIGISVLIAVTASFAALWLTFNLRSERIRHVWAARLGASFIMGLAIAGMHYAGMAAAQFRTGAICRGGVALDDRWLAVSVGVATIALLTVTLITMVFDAHLESRAHLHAQRLEKANRELNHQATHDALTQLANRSLFVQELQRVIESDLVESVVAVLFVDLDRFKSINDSLSHEYGDAILQQVARRLEQLVGENGMAARLGGDEFLVFVRVQCLQQVIRFADSIVRTLREPHVVKSLEMHLAASVGVTTFPFDLSLADALISHADEVMYDVKHAGGNAFQFFVPGTTLFTPERFQLENELRHACALGQLMLHYQPQVDIASGRIVGLEALARWQHPERGWVPPGDFIPLAERSDLILEIGQWILNEACQQARRWKEAGFQGISIAVNLSVRQFRQADLLSIIQNTVSNNGLEPGDIDIELTESIVMTDAEGAVATLRQLRSAGYCIAVDDFGIGYSSIGYLKRLPISTLKIDRCFVNDLATDAKSDAIVKAIVSLAHGLGMNVIAEGVETPMQLACLQACGCDQYQGYLYSRPKSTAEITQMLRDPPRISVPPIDSQLLLQSARL